MEKKQQDFNALCKIILSREWDYDENCSVLIRILERMVIGKKKYGHGLKVDDDTRKFGTKQDDWLEMALEEIMDMSVYLAAALERKLSTNHNKLALISRSRRSSAEPNKLTLISRSTRSSARRNSSEPKNMRPSSV